MSRPTTMSREGMVVAPHYLASQAGIHMLQEGGNAVEAALAAAAVLAVVYPHANSIGGDNFWLIHNAETGKTRALNASGRSGSLATLEYYRSRGLERIPARGYAAALTVPGAVSGWGAAYDYAAGEMRRGTKLAWKRLMAPAIRYAADGFPVSRNQAQRALIDFDPENEAFGNLQRFAECRGIFCDRDGRPWRQGEILVQADLARTLDLIAARGAADFYTGEIAARLAADSAANGGVFTAEDFAAHSADWVEPIRVRYRGYDALNLPPNTQGMAALSCLNILENFDLRQYPDGSADYFHLMAEVTKEAFRDRDRYLSDPGFVDIPLEKILSADYGRMQADRIRARSAAAGSPALVRGGDTVWIGVVDRHGSAVSLIQSICDGFGSGVVPARTGIVLQNRGKYFALDEVSPNRLLPRKRTFHTLIAGMLLEACKPRFVYGTMGGEGQPQTQTALVTRVIDFGMSPQEAIEAPRWLQGRFLDLTQPATQLHLEGRVADAVVADLRRRGHTVAMTTDYSDLMGHAGAIFIDPLNSVLHGGADPRGDGAAVGI